MCVCLREGETDLQRHTHPHTHSGAGPFMQQDHNPAAGFPPLLAFNLRVTGHVCFVHLLDLAGVV